MSTTAVPRRVGIIGLGLIAGSLAKALRQSDWQGELRAWDCDADALDAALQVAVIDAAADGIEGLLHWAELVVIGAPPAATADILRQWLPVCAALSSPPVLTDVASIKGHVVAAVPPHCPFFVPGHPIAGSEDSGVLAARADLFTGREVILTPLADTAPMAVQMVSSLWRQAGGWITLMSLADHDAALAASSHSPHMVAYALTHALGDHPLEPLRHGGGALRDMTRIAGSDPVMWRDVALTNRDALIAALTDFSEELAALRKLIELSDSEALEAYFSRCRQLRRAHDLILNPLPPEATQEQPL